MENPYARAAGSSAASPGQQRLSDYELAIGPNADHYLPKFEAFDAGGKRASWHWPAFFVTAPWFLYRKMFTPGVLMLIYPWVATIAFTILALALDAGAAVNLLLGLVLYLGPSVLLSVFATSLYHRHVNKLIRNIPTAIAQQPDKRVARIERNGGTGTGAMVGILVGGFFVATFFIGILAAIAIPAYQDYTIRSQVVSGLNLASSLKAEVMEFHEAKGTWPEQGDVTIPAGGPYVAAIEVQGGSIIISYGGQANEKIHNQRLVLAPALDMEDNISWICGNGKVEPGVRRADGPYGSEVDDKYMPTNCRTPR